MTPNHYRALMDHREQQEAEEESLREFSGSKLDFWLAVVLSIFVTCLVVLLT